MNRRERIAIMTEALRQLTKSPNYAATFVDKRRQDLWLRIVWGEAGFAEEFFLQGSLSKRQADRLKVCLETTDGGFYDDESPGSVYGNSIHLIDDPEDDTSFKYTLEFCEELFEILGSSASFDLQIEGIPLDDIQPTVRHVISLLEEILKALTPIESDPRLRAILKKQLGPPSLDTTWQLRGHLVKYLEERAHVTSKFAYLVDGRGQVEVTRRVSPWFGSQPQRDSKLNLSAPALEVWIDPVKQRLNMRTFCWTLQS